jgi:hypothetical protein
MARRERHVRRRRDDFGDYETQRRAGHEEVGQWRIKRFGLSIEIFAVDFLMSDEPPQVIIIARPNGAGKTTLAPFLLRDRFRTSAFG